MLIVSYTLNGHNYSAEKTTRAPCLCVLDPGSDPNMTEMDVRKRSKPEPRCRKMFEGYK